MAGRAYFTPDGRPLDTNNPDDREIVASHADAEERVPRGTFICEISRTAMYAKRMGDLVFLSHYPKEGHGCTIPFGMSDEHKREQEYWVRAADTAGYETHTEFDTGNHTRLDVAIAGRRRIGIEVQRHGLKIGEVKGRATRSLKAGWQTIWSDNMTRNAVWANHVPTVRPGSVWSDPKPPPRTARAVGPRRLHVVRCDWGQLGLRCRRPCRTLHAPEFELIDDLTIDDVAELAPGGGLVALRHRDAQYLVPPESSDRYQDLAEQENGSATASPTPRARPNREWRSTECLSSTHLSSPAVEPHPALKIVRARAADYDRAARAAGCTDEYPLGNRCSQCSRVPDDTLVPWRSGWRCRTCTYG